LKVRIILLGPPGVGKGTQGRRLAVDRGWPLISTGGILRDAIAAGTPLGLQAQAVMAAGQLVSDDVMIGLVRERTAQQDASAGFVLDGFPRTVPQAEALDGMLTSRKQVVDAVLSLSAPEDELVRRLSGRRERPVCKRTYHVTSAPPKVAGRCDDHPESELVQRPDDAEAVIRRRLEVYKAQTQPLVDHYGSSGRVIEVVGTGAETEVYGRLRQALGTAVAGRP